MEGRQANALLQERLLWMMESESLVDDVWLRFHFQSHNSNWLVIFSVKYHLKQQQRPITASVSRMHKDGQLEGTNLDHSGLKWIFKFL